MAEKEIAVKVEHLTKSFKIPLEASNGIKQKLINTLKGKKGYREFTPLNDISFEIEKGDFFGIVGRNGSGKSTLLKSIAGIYTPNAGAVHVEGKLVPFIELGVGFNPELTGRENVYLNGALLGFSHKEMEAMYDDIVDFAELHDFMEENLKNYSSGMQVRLAFSIAIRAKGDVLLLDEILAVGDEAFQRKCYAYFAELKKENKTVILVTHSMDSVQQFCNRAMLIDKGHIILNGKPSDVAEKYFELNSPPVAQGKVDDSNLGKGKNSKVAIKSNVSVIEQEIQFKLDIIPEVMLTNAVVTLVINNEAGEMVYRWGSDRHAKINKQLANGKSIKLRIVLDNIFPDGVYTVQIAVKKQDRTEDYLVVNRALTFSVLRKDPKKRNPYWKPHEVIRYEED